MQNPEYYIKPKEEWPESCKAGRVMCSAEVWRQLAQILYDRGILRCVADEDVPRATNGDFITNGMFGVTKQGQIPEGLAQVCRLIFRLKNSNDIMHCIVSDLFELPTGYGWEFVTLDDGETLLIAQEDIRSAFCIFRIPVGWSKCMTVTGKNSDPLPGRKGEVHVLGLCGSAHGLEQRSQHLPTPPS